MIDNELEQNLNEAFKLAHVQKHEFVTVEHLLLSLLENSDSLDLLNSNKVNQWPKIKKIIFKNAKTKIKE